MSSNGDTPRVGIVMGSDSDWPVMKLAGEALAEFDIAFEADVTSAHRMPEEMLEYGRSAADRGCGSMRSRRRAVAAPTSTWRYRAAPRRSE